MHRNEYEMYSTKIEAILSDLVSFKRNLYEYVLGTQGSTIYSHPPSPET